MYLVMKLFMEGANTARELTQHFANPGEEHWKELERVVAYLKHNKKKVKLRMRKPLGLRPGANINSDYIKNKEDR